MEGITHLERSALGVSLDSRPTEGALCLAPLQQWVFSSSLAARPVEGVAENVSDRKPVINPVQDINPDGRPMEGITYPENLAPGVSLDSGLRAGCQIWNHCHYRFINVVGRTTSSRNQDVTLEAGDKSGYGHYHGRSTYGGEYLPGASGCGSVFGQ